MRKFLYIIVCGIWVVACAQNPKQKAVSEKTENNMNFEQYIPAESKDIDRNNYF